MESSSSTHLSTEEIDAFELSYQSGVSLDRSGRIVSKEKKSALREQHGFCLTCPGVPVQLYEIKRSRLNPLWSSKKPRTVEGQCAKGRCLRCNPEHNHNNNRKPKHDNLSRNPSDTSTASTHSTDSQQQQQSHYNHRQQRRLSDNSVTSLDRNSSHGGGRVPRRCTTTSTNFNSSSSSHSRSSVLGEADRARRATVSSSMIRANARKSFGSFAERSHLGSGGGNDYMRSNSNHGNFHWDQDSDSRSMSAVDETRRRRDQLQARLTSNRRLESNRADSSRSFCDSSISSVGSHVMDDRSVRSSSSGATPRSRLSVTSSLSSRSLNATRPTYPAPQASHPRRSSGGNSASSCLRSQFLSKKHSESCRSLDSVDEEVPENEPVSPSTPTTTSTLESPQARKTPSLPVPCQQPQDQEEDSPDVVVESLQALLNDMQQMDSAELMSEILINSMDSHPKMEEVQLLCIRTVSQAFQQLDTMPFVAAHGHKRVLFAMKTFPSSLKIQSEGCEALCVLSVRDDTRLILTRAGSCTFVDKALTQFLGDAGLAASALKILRSLSFEQEGSSALEKLNMSTKMVEIMYCNLSSAEIQRDGCALLSNLAVDVEKQRVSAVDKNILAVVVAGMQEHEEDNSVIASACFALKNLTHEESNLRALSRVESVLPVIYAATKIEEAVEDASIVMERIQMSMAQDESLEEHASQSLKDMMEQRSEHPEVVEKLIDHFKIYSWSERVTFECVKTIQSLVSESETHRAEFAKEVNVRKLKACIESSNLEQATHDKINRLIELAKEQQNQETATAETSTTSDGTEESEQKEEVST